MYKKNVILFTIISILVFCSSACRKDFEYAPSGGNLSFSKDTVFLDTVFSGIGSATYTLKVYNQTKDDVLIPSISLENGTASLYRLNVNGTAGTSFTDIPLYEKDSLFIFVETTVDFQSNEENSFLYTDAIQFDSGGDQQNVQLVTLIQDAIFLFPNTNPDGTKETVVFNIDTNGDEIRTQGFELDDDQLNFSNEKPYVIYGYAAVPNGKNLEIDSGARVHFHKDSGLLVQRNGTISINGILSQDQELLEGEVIFEGDRLETVFSKTPGQWGSIWIAEGSINNTIDHLTLKNGTIGLYVEGDEILNSPTLTIRNSQIYNNSNYNLFANHASINGENVVLGNAGLSSLYCNNGGNYSFVHSTIANYWSTGFRSSPALTITNYDKQNNDAANDLMKADFKNCIIDGANQLELLLRTNGQNTFNYNFMNCILKFNDSSNQFENNSLYDFESSANYTALQLNGFSDFLLPTGNNFRIGLNSDAVDAGDINTAAQVPSDILGNDRITNPDLGAFQATSKE